MNWFKRLWNRLLRVFNEFMKIAIPEVTQLLFAEFKDFIVAVVESLETVNMSGDDKFKEAKEALKKEAIRRGVSISSSLANLLIQLAVQYVRNK